MCDCPEIQGLAPIPSEADFHQYWYTPEKYKDSFELPMDAVIWLPRQDQLQEMVSDQIGLWVMLEWICQFQQGYFAKPNTEERYEPNVDSMEQLWLAFVMKEKHMKTWDGDKWI